MKLLFCRKCEDVVKLSGDTVRHCECNATSGRLQAGDYRFAHVDGAEAEVIEIDRLELASGIRRVNSLGEDFALSVGASFEARVLPHAHWQIIRRGDQE